MASKRKQDDKHLKLLREMVSREHNKTCFECSQRGPTYVDMTIGTFVCTSCSGILRGLNPPHRVKSISMASYTSTEMEFLEKHGNEVCRHVWLGLCNSSAQRGPESKEDSKVRDYLVQKYEKKRWYVEPGQAAILAAAKAKEDTSSKKNSSSAQSTPEPKPLKSLVGSNAPPLKVMQPPGHSASAHNIGKAPRLAQTATKQKSVDLLADLGPDPFTSASHSGFGQAPFSQPSQSTLQQGALGQQAAFDQSVQQGGFADFSQAFGGPIQAPQAQAFMPAQVQTNTAAPANNSSFGAFESAFSPQQPIASSGAPALVTGLQGLAVSGSSPAASVPSGGGGDKYAAFASLGDEPSSTGRSINWGDGGGVSTGFSSGGIVWGSGGGGGNLDVKNTSGAGTDWATSVPKSSMYSFPGSGTTTTSSSAAFGSLPSGATGTSIATSNAQGNPFMGMSTSGATPATSTMVANPFLASGAPASIISTPVQSNGLFGVQPSVAGMPAANSMVVGGMGGFNQVSQHPQQPGSIASANVQMNGRVRVAPQQGQIAGTGGFTMQPAAVPNQFGMQGQMGLPPAAQLQPANAGMSFGGAGMATMAGLQFGKSSQPAPGMSGFGHMGPAQPVLQSQPLPGWGTAPGMVPQQNANPFMGSVMGETIPPKSNSSNPFL